MNVEDAQKQLGETAIKFRVHWESLRAGWNDEASAAFEPTPLSAHLPSLRCALLLPLVRVVGSPQVKSRIGLTVASTLT